MSNMTPDPALDTFLDGRFGAPNQGFVAPGYARNPTIQVSAAAGSPLPVVVTNDCTSPVMTAVCEPVIDYEKVVLCDPVSESLVLVISSIDATTGVPTPVGYNMDGTIFAGDMALLRQCDTPEIESDPVEMCDCDGMTTFLRWYIKQDGQVIGCADSDLKGNAYIPCGTPQIGSCESKCPPATPAGVLPTW